MSSRCSTTIIAALLAACLTAAPSLAAEDLSNLDKGHRLLIQNGLQVIGLVSIDDVFTEQTYKNANYTSILWWQGGSNPSAAPDMTWVRSVPNPSQMPTLLPSENGAYLNKLLALSLGDEQNLNDRNPGGVFDQNVQWVQQTKSNPAYNNAIIYVNNWGSQILDNNLNDFITQAHPDMISFDTYPWYADGGENPTDWFAQTRRYRVFANANNIPFGLYRQTYHATSDSPARRDPSPSEQNLNTFGALAFGATYLADFTYNTGASALFDRFPNDPNHGAGDLLPNAAYYREATLNLQAHNLGRALVRLKQVNDYSAGTTIPTRGIYSPNQIGHTTSMMFIRGQHLEGAAPIYNALPGGFEPDREAPKDANGNAAYSDWVFTGNDPYLNGFTVTNPGTRNNALPGDVLLSWFTPLDESFDGSATNERYLMVVNALIGPDGAAADYRQHILLNFAFGSTGINTLQRLDENTGKITDVPLTYLGSTGRYQLALDLDGGMGALFKFKDGAAFVLPEPTTLSLFALASTTTLLRRKR